MASRRSVAGRIAEGGEVSSGGSRWILLARTFAQNRLAIGDLVIIGLRVLFSFIGPLIYHTDQLTPNLVNVNLAPGAHPLGTDSEGYDILGWLMEGGQSSIEVGSRSASSRPSSA